MCFTITVRSLAIVILWAIGLVVAVLDALFAYPLTALAVVIVGAAATVSVRAQIDKYAANWQAAYGAGREVAKVRQMR